MDERPFVDVRPAKDEGHAEWVLETLIPSPRGGVSFRVPRGFDATVRIRHQLRDSASWSTIVTGTDLRRASALAYPLPDPLEDVAGDLSGEEVDQLAPVLRGSTESPDLIHFAQWLGWGDLERG